MLAGATDGMVKEMGFDRNAKCTEMAMERIFGSCESFFVTYTRQFGDYSKYVAPVSIRRPRKNSTRSSSRSMVRRRSSSGPGLSGRISKGKSDTFFFF